ncbi:dihydrodipicolinate reductase [bacterium]|nr:dihydrodipicolinate reductase [bacterium]
MNIALVGYGKMGKMIERLTPDHDVRVAARFDIDCPFSNNSKVREQLRDVPVLVEFSTPDTVMKNIELGLSMGKHMVIGTTGWHSHLNRVENWVKDTNTGLIYAANFSLGVNLFYEILERAGNMISRFDHYDPFIEEAHHQFKKDAPSGTALVIKNMIQMNYRKNIPVSSVRAGYIPGTHVVGFDSRVDTIRLEHVARNREGFAEGALIASKWIEKRKGCFDFRDAMKDLLQ